MSATRENGLDAKTVEILHGDFMLTKFWFRLTVTVFLFSTVFGCENRPVSDSVTNPNVPAATPSPEPTPFEEQSIKLVSAGNVVIVGTFYKSPKPKSPAVLLLHQWQSDRHSFDNFAKQLQANGIGVLAIDGRGFGESVKTSDGKSVAPARTDDAVKGMLADVKLAFTFLSVENNVDPERIGIIGASYGSSLAIIYAASQPEVKAVALLSPGLNYFGNIPAEPAVKSFGDRPLLLVASDDDKESAESVRKLLKSGANDKYQMQIYPKGGHGTGIFNAKVGLEDLLEQFLARSL